MSYRSCRRRWNWLFNDRWYPQTTAKPQEFGAAFHVGMESWYSPEMWGKDPETRLTLAVLAFTNKTREQKYAYLRQMYPDSAPSTTMDPEVEADYKERVELGVGMLRYHCQKVSPLVDHGFKPIRVEVEFEVPI